MDQQPIWTGVLMLPWGLSALVTAGVVAVWRWARRSRIGDGDRMPNGFSMAVAWLLVPLTLAWLATATDAARLLSPRYLAASAPAALVLLALALSAVPDAGVRAIVAGAFAIVGTATSPVIRSLAAGEAPIAWRTDDWRGAVAYFNMHPLHGRGTVMLRSLYPLDAPRTRLMPLRRSNPGELRPETVARIDTARFAWLIVGGTPLAATQVASRICEQLSARSGTPWAPSSARAFGSVSVTLLERRER